MQETTTAPNPTYGELAEMGVIQKTIESLKDNGFEAEFVENGAQAKQKLLSMIPEKSRVFNAASATLAEIGVDQEINESGKYEATRGIFYNPESTPEERKKAGYIVDYVVGSVHALTQDGHALIASRTGSQLASYVYGADHVIWVVGSQKIVWDTQDGLKRIREYALPLENVRSQKAYGQPSRLNNILLINSQDRPRIHVILVGEKLGF